MKLACFRKGPGGQPRLGVYTDAGIIEVKGRLAKKFPSIRAVIENKGFPGDRPQFPGGNNINGRGARKTLRKKRFYQRFSQLN